VVVVIHHSCKARLAAKALDVLAPVLPSFSMASLRPDFVIAGIASVSTKIARAVPNAGLRGRPRFPLGPLFRRGLPLSGGSVPLGTELGYLLLRVGNEALKKLQHCVARDTLNEEQGSRNKRAPAGLCQVRPGLPTDRALMGPGAAVVIRARIPRAARRFANAPPAGGLAVLPGSTLARRSQMASKAFSEAISPRSEVC
jgi:hypothetical protein